MHRRTFLLASAAAIIAARPGFAQQLSLNALSTYLNGIVNAQSPFTQVNDDGTLATGTLYIRRPGRMRFEYDPPTDLLVMAGGGQVGIFDGKSNVGKADRYPLSRTPLNLILERNVDLARRNMVVGHEFDGTATVVTAQDPEHPEYGSISLKFTDGPIELRQWVIRDGQGATTTVILGQLEQGEPIANRLFDINREETNRQK
ncbi:MAG: outer membrane lipoprotein carrier protein LolA [Boseongicola sp.]|nr:outer membrane lipoprotein carrier protein LolA [Boseongicola sp.]NNJ68132.1 outer membrane lipoprotein carrier protein LolA [Boseongicola sp.]